MNSFIYAPSSRDRLNITREMAQQVLSYHQVMPSFLNRILPFGFSEIGQDCNTTTFQDRILLTSGKEPFPHRVMEHCYGLRAVEHNRTHVAWPWSVRLCSIYHSLDLKSDTSTAHATWIVIKANRLIEKLVTDAMSSTDRNVLPKVTHIIDALATASSIHTLVAMWSSSNWPWYISFLESKVQTLTSPTLSFTAAGDSMIEPDIEIVNEPAPLSGKEKPTVDEGLQQQPLRFSKTWSSLYKGSDHKHKAGKSLNNKPIIMRVYDHHFSFKDIPEIHSIEEKANEALDALNNNDQVLEDLRKSYFEVFRSLGRGNERAHGCGVSETSDEPAFGLLDKSVYDRFAEVLSRVQKDLRSQQSRLKQLLRLLRDRKALVRRNSSYR